MREVPLQSVCEIKNGYAFKSSEFKANGVPLLRISSFDNGPVFFDDKTVFIDRTYLDTKSAFKVEKGDVLIALSGATTGKFGLYTHDEPSLLNQRIGLLKSGVSEELDDKYFYYYLSILQAEILRKAGGAAQPNISTKAIGEFIIPLPPLDQQKKIASILDAADAYRQKSKALIEKYDELTLSLFLEMFGDPVINPKGWEIKPIKEFGRVVTGNTPSRKNSAYYSGEFIE
jgi:type I restriction enzyme S subunit